MGQQARQLGVRSMGGMQGATPMGGDQSMVQSAMSQARGNMSPVMQSAGGGLLQNRQRKSGKSAMQAMHGVSPGQGRGQMRGLGTGLGAAMGMMAGPGRKGVPGPVARQSNDGEAEDSDGGGRRGRRRGRRARRKARRQNRRGR